MVSPTEDITIRVKLGVEETAVLKPPGFERERGWGRRIFKIQVAVCFCLAIGLFFAFHRFPDDGRIALIPGIVAILVLGVATYFASDLPTMRRRFAGKEQLLKEAYAGQWQLTAGREGLTVRHGSRMEVIAWGQIEKTEADEQCIDLDLGRGEYLILPRKRVLEGDWEAFVDRVCRYTAGSNDLKFPT